MDEVEIICSSPQGSVIELHTDSNMEETLNRSHISIHGLTSEELDELNDIPDASIQIVSSPEVPSAQLTSFRMRSPVKRLSPLKSNLLIESSQSSSLYCTARDHDNEFIVTNIEIKGSNLILNDKNTKIIPLKRDIEEEIPQSSEDEGESSLIEIKRFKKSKIQVISSQNFNSSPLTSPNKFILSDNVLNEKIISDDEKIMSNNDNDDDTEFDEMTLNELKKKIIEFGLKPSNSKFKMINSLKEIYKKIQPETKLKLSQFNSNENLIKNSQNLIKFDIFNKLNKKFLINKGQKNKLFEKIYTFQPINKNELKEFFKNELNDTENDDLILKNWCDWNSICLTED